MKIVPGEIYCRWRDAHDEICVRVTSALQSDTKCTGRHADQKHQELEFTDKRDLRAHYRDAHNLRCERPGSASLTRRDNMHVARKNPVVPSVKGYTDICFVRMVLRHRTQQNAQVASDRRTEGGSARQ